MTNLNVLSSKMPVRSFPIRHKL